MNALPSFSIVMPTYQRREAVCDAVRALVAIEYTGKIELIVVVDGSTDGTAASLAEIEVPFPCRLIEQPNRGAAAARNRGAAEATGEILLFLDDDMMSAADILVQHAASHAAGADAVVGGGGLDPASPDGFLSAGIGEWLVDSRDGEVVGAFHVFTGQLSIRRALFEQLGGFDTAFTESDRFGNEDADFGARLLQRHRVIYNPKALTLQRYLVGPRENMERAVRLGRADVHFLRKHPALLPELLALRRSDKTIVRYLYRPFGRLPLIPRLCGRLAVAIAEAALRTRWRNSRVVARAYYAARSLAYWSAVHAAGGFPSARRALVLCYHIARGTEHDPALARYGVSPERFASHVARLERRGFHFITPDHLLALLERGVALPRRSVLLTFDDCYVPLLETVREALAPRRIASLAFAVTRLTSNAWDQPAGARELQLLDAAGLRGLAALGCEIGAHTRSHRPMPELSEAELDEETRGAAEDIAAMNLPRPRFFAYPFGLNDSRGRAAVERAGFRAAFLVQDHAGEFYATPAVPKAMVPRLDIGARDTGWRFALKTRWPRLAVRL